MKGNFHEKAVETGMTKKELKAALKLYRKGRGFMTFKADFNRERGMDRMAVLPTELIEYISEKQFGKRD